QIPIVHLHFLNIFSLLLPSSLGCGSNCVCLGADGKSECSAFVAGVLPQGLRLPCPSIALLACAPPVEYVDSLRSSSCAETSDADQCTVLW
ncbi:uncharacterized protein MYCGRDRAFT_102031, partial [Zymoseptoria tritici IPO323]